MPDCEQTTKSKAIVTKLRQVEILTELGMPRLDVISQIGVTERLRKAVSDLTLDKPIGLSLCSSVVQ